MATRIQPFKLDREDIDGLLDSQRQLTDILPTIDAAERCGIDCTKYRADHAAAMQQITQIITEFSPKSAMRNQ
jgi:hypothetical protein